MKIMKLRQDLETNYQIEKHKDLTVKPIGVVGGGPAGMATAILLHQKGFNVASFEKHDSPKPVGAGIMLHTTGLKV